MSSPRAIAADIIGRVLKGQSLSRLLPDALDAATTSQRPLCQELVYGTLREWPCLEETCLSFLSKPMRRKDQDIMALLCIGLYELEHLSTPAHAVVSETVNATRALKKPWAKGVVNGVLRAYQRQEGVAREALSPAAQRALPVLTTKPKKKRRSNVTFVFRCIPLHPAASHCIPLHPAACTCLDSACGAPLAPPPSPP